MKTVLRQAGWFAIVAGLAEAALLLAHSRQIHGFIYLSPHLVWMAPLANLVWFGIAAALWIPLTRMFPRLGGPRAWLALFLALAALTILLLPSQLHRIAGMAIALGVGIQGSRMLLPRLPAFNRLVRVTLVPLVVLVAALAAGPILISRWQEKRELAALGEARPGARNIILIVLDTVRRASLSLYGYDRPTWPAMEKWSRRGVRFDHAIATSSWTLPSHGSMFTGRWASEMSGSWLTPLDATHPVLAERLTAEGYGTAGFVANILYCNRSFGLARGFTHYEDYGISVGELIVNSSLGRALSETRILRRITGNFDILGRKPGPAITDRFLTWEASRDRPYFAFLNYFDAHQPYFPPDGLAEAFGPTAPRNLGLLELRPYMGKIADAETELTPDQVTAERNAYDATLRYLDQEMDRLLTELERRGRLENTVVIITSDHGEQFMEHGLFDHGNSLYRFATEVPLIMIGAGIPPGVVSAPVTLRDLPATVMDLADLPGGSFPGVSLRGFWEGSRTAEPLVSEVWGPGPHRRFQSVVDQGYHAIWSADSAELYAFEADPSETRNLARTPDGSARIEAMRARFREIRPGQDMIP